MPVSPFSPAAIRKSRAIKRRILGQKLKAYDKYKLDLDQQEGERLKAIAGALRDDGSKSYRSEDYERDTIFYQTAREISEDDDDETMSSRTSTGHVELYFKKINFLGRCLNKFVRQDATFRLKWWEFFCINFSLQVPLLCIMRHIHMINLWGSTLVAVVYATCVITIGMPIFMLYNFFGDYTRKSFIKFWDCVPILRGMAYSIILTQTTFEVLNLSYAGLALVYLTKVVAVKVPWVSCNFPNAHPDCVPMYQKHRPYTTECCDGSEVDCDVKILNQSFKFGAMDYYYSHILERGYAPQAAENKLLWRWATAATFEWILMFTSMMVGVRKFRGITTRISLVICCLFLPVIIVSLIISPQYSMIRNVNTNIASIFDYKFWIQVITHALHRELPSDILTYSAVSKPVVSTTVDTVSIYTMKLLFMTVLTVWLSISVSFVQEYYNVKEALCIRTEGRHFIFAVIPDIITRWPIPQLWLVLYFAVVFYWGFSSSMYVMNSSLEALLEEYPSLEKWRFIIAGLYCMVVGSVNVYLLRPNNMDVYRFFSSRIFGQVKISLFFISLVGIFIYSVERFRNDYHFAYGIMLSDYWIHGIKIALLLLGLLFFTVFTLKVGEFQTVDIFLVLTALFPLIAGIVIVTVRYFVKIKPTLLDPDPKWGPPGRKKKLARSRFDPTHELHYRSALKACTHNCLLRSTALKKEIKYWQTNRAIYSSVLEGVSEKDD